MHSLKMSWLCQCGSSSTATCCCGRISRCSLLGARALSNDFGQKLLLSPRPCRTSVQLTSACSISKKADLDRYATLHTQTYGEAVHVLALITHMLAAFMVRDQGSRALHGNTETSNPN